MQWRLGGGYIFVVRILLVKRRLHEPVKKYNVLKREAKEQSNVFLVKQPVETV